MKTIFTLFVATIVLLSCNNNVKEIQIDRKAGEWVSSGAKYVIDSDEKVVIVKKLIEGVAEYCPDAFVCIISNPVNSTVPIAREVLKKAGK